MQKNIATVLGLISLVLIYFELSGSKVPLIPQGYRAGFIALGVLGFAMCAIDGVVPKKGQVIDWTSPQIIIGSILGVIALLALLSMIFFKKVPLVSDKTAFIALAAIIIIKFAINIFARK